MKTLEKSSRLTWLGGIVALAGTVLLSGCEGAAPPPGEPDNGTTSAVSEEPNGETLAATESASSEEAASAKPIEITEANFEEEVLNSSQPVLLDAWATWCGPCRILEPTIEELASEYAGRVKVGKLDVDKNPNLAREMGIQSIPAVFVFKNGKIAETLIGVQPKEKYVEALNL